MNGTTMSKSTNIDKNKEMTSSPPFHVPVETLCYFDELESNSVGFVDLDDFRRLYIEVENREPGTNEPELPHPKRRRKCLTAIFSWLDARNTLTPRKTSGYSNPAVDLSTPRISVETIVLPLPATKQRKIAKLMKRLERALICGSH